MKRDKYLQIFNYLLEFSKLRSNPVRDIESSDTQYPDRIWFADIPQYEIFDCITFPNYNQDANYWLKINRPEKKPQPPEFPNLSKTLSDWIVIESLKDENEIPFLKDTIEINGKTISLIDKPEVESEFQSYLNNKWIDDLEFYKNEIHKYEVKLLEYENRSSIYKKLFSIYNKAQQFGEEYELIVGVGILYFKANDISPLICRHILTTKVEITFDENNFAITVSPSLESELKIETDSIIDLDEIFDSHNIIEAEKIVQKIIAENEETNPFSDITKQSLLAFSKRFHTEGDFIENLLKPKDIQEKPTVYFAPALLLRKRNTRSFTALYEKIIEHIANSDDSIDIPLINDIIGDFENHNGHEKYPDTNYVDTLIDETIYFPKKYNDEQIEIVEKTRRNKKVLVQGPPGTGKSHTIANLICHLLANGNKVLVTAYTKRALEVLKKLLPEDFQNLTVNLLSGDSISIQDLDSSVNAINDELSRITNLNTMSFS